MTPLEYLMLYMLINAFVLMVVAFSDPSVIPYGISPFNASLAAVLTLLLLIPGMFVVSVIDMSR